jgi:hypothetical protein
MAPRMLRTARAIAAFLSLPSLLAAAQSTLPRQVAAPASDILSGLVRLPPPSDAPMRSRAALLPVEFTWSEDGVWRSELRLPVEAAGPLAIALAAPDAASWRASVDLGGGAFAPLESAPGLGRIEKRAQVLESELPGWVVERFDVERGAPGWWTVRVEVPGSASQRPSGGWLVAAGSSPLRVEAWTSTALTVADAPIAVLARLAGGPAALVMQRSEVRIEVGGRSQTFALADDGTHADGDAGDGVFGAWLPPWTSGSVHARVELEGRLSGGTPFLRSVALDFPVLERRAAWTGLATSAVEDELLLRIDLEAWPLGPTAKLHVSAEVWGRDAAGRDVPVCWLSRMSEPEPSGVSWRVPLWLDGRWLDIAGASLPLELRNVRLQDPETDVVFDLAERMPLETLALPSVVGRGQREVTQDMLRGALAGSLGAGPTGPLAPATHLPKAQSLMLVHGYCSGGNVWPQADFTQPKTTFSDPNANRTHDQFAVLMDQQAQAAGVASFGVVAHSQGGAAALHLLTYYTSGLDRAVGPRRIQSVATPYQGTPLASLGSFACGVNNDMTPAGAATWLAGIPSWARAEVYYWTTSDSGSACNFLTSLFLSDPEDGTVEKDRGQLPGGHSMGHVTGWCHTTGMTYPANYTDHARNQEMNAQAAR